MSGIGEYLANRMKVGLAIHQAEHARMSNTAITLSDCSNTGLLVVTGTTAKQLVKIADLSKLLKDGCSVQVDLAFSFTANTNGKTLSLEYGSGVTSDGTIASTTRTSGTANGFNASMVFFTQPTSKLQRPFGMIAGDQSAALPALVAYDPAAFNLFVGVQLANASDTAKLISYAITVRR